MDEESKKLWEELRALELKDKASKMTWNKNYPTQSAMSAGHIDCEVLLDCNIREKIQEFKKDALPEWYHINFCCECGRKLEALTQEDLDYERTKGLLHSCCSVTKELKLDSIQVSRNSSGEKYPFSLKFCFHCGSLIKKRTNYQ